MKKNFCIESFIQAKIKKKNSMKKIKQDRQRQNKQTKKLLWNRDRLTMM